MHPVQGSKLRSTIAALVVAATISVPACTSRDPGPLSDAPFEDVGALSGGSPVGAGEAAWLGVPLPVPRPGRSYSVISVTPIASSGDAGVVAGVADIPPPPGLMADAADAYDVRDRPLAVTEALLAERATGIAVGLTIAPGNTHASVEGLAVQIEYEGRIAWLRMPIGLVACDRDVPGAPELCGAASDELYERMKRNTRWGLFDE